MSFCFCVEQLFVDRVFVSTQMYLCQGGNFTVWQPVSQRVNSYIIKNIIVYSIFVAFILQDLTLKHGWRTGAIIPELRKEIKIMNTEEYVHIMTWLQALTGLIEQMQVRRLHMDICVTVFFFFGLHLS